GSASPRMVKVSTCRPSRRSAATSRWMNTNGERRRYSPVRYAMRRPLAGAPVAGSPCAIGLGCGCDAPAVGAAVGRGTAGAGQVAGGELTGIGGAGGGRAGLQAEIRRLGGGVDEEGIDLQVASAPAVAAARGTDELLDRAGVAATPLHDRS